MLSVLSLLRVVQREEETAGSCFVRVRTSTLITVHQHPTAHSGYSCSCPVQLCPLHQIKCNSWGWRKRYVVMEDHMAMEGMEFKSYTYLLLALYDF